MRESLVKICAISALSMALIIVLACGGDDDSGGGGPTASEPIEDATVTTQTTTAATSAGELETFKDNTEDPAAVNKVQAVGNSIRQAADLHRTLSIVYAFAVSGSYLDSLPAEARAAAAAGQSGSGSIVATFGPSCGDASILRS